MDSSSIPSLLETGQFLLSLAKTRWLFPEEIYILLAYDPAEYGMEVMTVPVPTPTNGQLYIFSANSSVKYDMVSWAKKKSQGRIQETYMNLKINGSELIRGIYCKAGDNPNFRRRIYRLIKADSKQLCIVHYRTCVDDEKPERPILSPQVSFFLNQHMLPRSNGYPSEQHLPYQPHSIISPHYQPDSHSILMAHRNPPSNQIGEEFDELINDLLQHDGDMMGVQHPESYPTQADVFHEQQIQYNFQVPFTGIVDFAPEIVKLSSDPTTNIATKVLICLNDHCSTDMIKIRLILMNSMEYHEFLPERITSTVLKLMVPPLTPGRWILSLVNAYGQVLYYHESHCIKIVQDNTVMVKTEPTVKLGKRQFHHGSPKSRERKQTDSIQVGNIQNPSFYGYHAPTVSNVIFNHQVPDSVVDREYKIRIVEKLGSVKSALLHDESEHGHAIVSHPIACTSGNHPEKGDPSTGDMIWLDELEVSKMSNNELEIAMDQYITTIMKELVNFAALDDDLKAEINSLDPSGYSLLHYCSIYDLRTLIPILVSRGAEVNQHSGSGSTPLHLAVAAGHAGATEVLIANGADLHLHDANHLTAYEIARHGGFDKIQQILAHAIGLNPSVGMTGTESPMREINASPIAMMNRIMSPETTSTSNGFQSSDRSDKDPSKLLHKAFASLSLTDKCALSISMKQHAANSNNSLQNTPRTFPNVPAMNDSSSVPSFRRHNDSFDQDFSKEMQQNHLNHFQSDGFFGHHDMTQLHAPGRFQAISNNLGALGENSSTPNGFGTNEDDISEIQSVLSFQDNESLEKAMSLMGDYELQQVEEEVRKIQNNVRGWILRKNYINLKEAAKVLQTAWREKKKTHTTMDNSESPLGASYGISMDPSTLRLDKNSSSGPATGRSSNSESHLPEMSHAQNWLVSSHSSEMNDTEVLDRAAATLQAATRRMIARKSFTSIRKQTMASLVIQKHLLKWWANNKQINQEESNNMLRHFQSQFN